MLIRGLSSGSTVINIDCVTQLQNEMNGTKTRGR